ncbi:hypothetical protein LSTR_LSTR016829 [Laodelphax striatellus]|uniref:Uncharacterized protein n=1 Tax=Laodelphax striatellus TaxID=195883 RepID=A0A482X7J2_LAOST|nr:hypothetical protein LSTR_LSTR016829 [Laodelphax striatellus]
MMGTPIIGSGLSGDMRKRAWSRSSSKAQLLSPSSAHALNNNLDLATASWRMESIVRDSDDSAASGDEEEFFDCQDFVNSDMELEGKLITHH